MVARGASQQIGQKAAQTNYYASEQARRIGFPLTHMVTINLSSTLVEPQNAVTAFSRLRRNHFNKWAARPRKGSGRPFPPTYAFAFENVRDKVPFMTMEAGDPHNVHVHWAVHIAPARFHDFTSEIWSWVESVTGGITGGAETISIVALEKVHPGYISKGMPPALGPIYGRGYKPCPQGIILGRRADTSRNLGPTARRALDRQLGIRRQILSRKAHAARSPAEGRAYSPN